MNLRPAPTQVGGVSQAPGRRRRVDHQEALYTGGNLTPTNLMRPTTQASRTLVALLLALSPGVALAVGAQESDPADPAFFTHQVAPILRSNCFACHGPLRQRGGLRLDSRPAMLVGGDAGAAVVPGSAADSLLFQAILRNGGLEMPPPRSLADDEIATLKSWLDAGAVWSTSTAEVQQSAGIVARDVPHVDVAAVGDFSVNDSATGDQVTFNHDIRPLLSKHCYECHGPDEAARQAGLRLDTREGAVAELPSGRRAIRPGDLEGSQLFHRVAASAREDRMPPAEGPEHALSQDDIETLGRFILQGAEWQDHWALLKPEKGTTPSIADTNWPRNDVDRFVLARLEGEGLAPSPQAERRTLIRRLSLDLTGLPPVPTEVETFVSDTRPDAYEHLVDRLLASPRYGEHAARYWLDAARYADTNGYHIDNERFMWRWREWVIDAFNSNQPFDQFTIDQLAGDLLPEPTEEQLIATGFHRNHMINFEGGAIPEEYRTQYVFDRVDTTATVWLGLTVGCAKCHDHKFDPISQKEYYQFAAFFNSIEEEGLDGFSGNAKPLLPAPNPSQARQQARILGQLEPLYQLLDKPRPKVDRDMKQWHDGWRAEISRKWQLIEPTEIRSQNGAEFERKPDGSILVTGPNPDNDTIEVTAELAMEGVRALRIEALRDTALPKGGIGRSTEGGTFTLTDLEVEVALPGETFSGQPIKFTFGFADHRHAATPVALAIDEDEATGWAADFDGKETKRTAVFLTRQPFDAPAGSRLRVRLHHQSAFPQRIIGRLRLSVSNDEAMTTSERSRWSWSGPYPDFEASQNVSRTPDLTARYPDGRLVWTEVEAFRAPASDSERESDPFRDELYFPAGATRLFRTLNAPSERVANYIVSADGYRFWLNGKQVAECLPIFPTDEETDEGETSECRGNDLELELRSGRNQVFAEIWSAAPPEESQTDECQRTEETQRTPFRISLEQETVGSLSFDLEALLTTSDEQLTTEESTRLRRHYRRNYWPRFEREEERFVLLEEELVELEALIPTTMVMAEREEMRPTFVLLRGQYDLHGEQVNATTPAALPSLVPASPDLVPNRLDLARWLVSDDQPLTARVTVNRFWQRFFGHGLVKTSEDFGAQGQLPSHPELLDWLASEFVASGWDMKELQRQIVNSATYRQSSRVSPEMLKRDPENRLLARASRFRLDAEVLRDSALTYAGLLVEKIGGPGVNPYQPPGLWKEIGYESRGRFSAGEFVQDSDQDLYRRSLYTFWKRTVPPPNMLVFDAPNRETCTVKRGISNTPLQALTLLNDPQYVEAARALAERILIEGPANDDERLARAFQLVLSRDADRGRGRNPT